MHNVSVAQNLKIRNFWVNNWRKIQNIPEYSIISQNISICSKCVLNSTCSELSFEVDNVSVAQKGMVGNLPSGLSWVRFNFFIVNMPFYDCFRLVRYGDT